MSPELGKAVYVVEIDSRDFDRALDRLDKRTKKSTVEEEKDINRVGEAWESTTEKIDDATDSTHEHQRETHKTTVKVTKDVDRQRSTWDRLTNSLGEVAKAAIGIGAIVKLMKFPVLIAGAGAAAQALSALAGGATALVGSLASATGGIIAMTVALGPLAGGLASAAAGYSMLGQAMLTIKLAQIKDITDALAGNEDAMKRLGPAARDFVDTLKGMKGLGEELRTTVQENMFGRLAIGVEAASKNFDVLKQVLGGTATVLGTTGQRFGELLGSKGFGKDFAKIGRTNNVMLERLGETLIHLVSALRYVLVAARPLNKWLSGVILQWAKGREEAAKLGEAAGTLGRFFNKTRRITEVLGDSLGNLWSWLKSVGRAGFSTGMSLWKSFEKWTSRLAKWASSQQGQNAISQFFERGERSLHILLDLLGPFTRGIWNILKLGTGAGNTLFREMGDAAKSFQRWTESAKGRNAIRQYFQDILPPLRAAGSLLRDLFVGLVKMGGKNADVTTDLLNQIRVDLLPRIFKLLTNTTKRLGPALITTFDELIKAFIHLAGASGPLILFLKVVNTTLKGVNFLLQNQVIRSFAVWAVTLLSVGKAMKWVVGGLMALRNAFIVQKVIIPLVEAFMAFRNGLIAMTAAEGAAATATTGLGLAFRGLLLASGVGAAILAATLIVQHWDKVKAVLGAVWDWMKGAASAVGKAVAGAFTWLADKVWWAMEHGLLGPIGFLITKWKTIVAVAKWVFNAVVDVVQWGVGAVKKLLQIVVNVWTLPFKLWWKVFGGIIKRAWNFVKGVFKAGVGIVKTIIGGFVNIVKDRFQDAKTFIIGPLRSAWSWIKNAFGNIAGWFGDKFGKVKDAIKGALHGVGGFMSGLFNGIKDSVISAVNWIIDKINWLIRQYMKLPGPLRVAGDINEVPKLMTSADKATLEIINSLPGKAQAAAGAGASPGGRNRGTRSQPHAAGAQRGGLVVEGGIIPFRGYQRGGLVGARSMPPGPRDTVPAMLQPGEMVLPVDMVKKMGKQTGDGSKILKKFHKFNDDTFKKIRKKTGAENEDTRKKLLKEYERMNKDGTKEADRLKDDTIDRMVRAREGASKQSNTMRANVTSSFKSMASAGKDAINDLGDAVNKALKALNMKPVSFGTEGGSSGGDAQKTPPKRAIGGVVVPGKMSGDKHTLALNGVPIAKVESGEKISVKNRTATAKEMVENRRTPRRSGSGRPSWLSKHSLGGVLRHFAGGGGVEQPPGDPGSEVVQAGYGKAVGRFLQRFDMDLTQGYGGASSPSVSPGHTTLGVPPSLDVVPRDGNWDGAFASGLKWALAQGMNTLYDGQYGTTPWPNHGEGNHAHIDWGGDAGAKLPPGSAMGLVIKKIKRKMITGPDGVMKSIAQGSSDKVWKAANAFLQKKGAFTSGGFISGGAGDVPAVMGHILMRAGLDREGAAGIIGNAYAESNWVTTADDGSGNGGLFGFTTPPVSMNDLRNYAAQVKQPWDAVSTQVNFMLKNGFEGTVRNAVMAANSPEAAAERFMTLWERPGIPRLDVRQAAARKAYNMKSWATGGVLPPYAGAFERGGVVPGPIGAPRTAIVHGGETVRPLEGAVTSGRARPRAVSGNQGKMSGRMRIENWKDGTALFEVIAEDVADELIEADKRSSRRG